MNEQIRALAKEAEDYAEGIVAQLETVRGGEFHEAYTKKFAQLVWEEAYQAGFDQGRGEGFDDGWEQAQASAEYNSRVDD
jgi:hypothetical protein